jgi:mannose-6-phosphate isomerase
MIPRPYRLIASYRDKIWGVTNLAPWFGAAQSKVGEVWFVPPGEKPHPILVKFIFTSERLSVQVHPDDAYAQVHDGIPGKTEMWHILRAEPGAQLALGLRESLSRERLRQAALSGEIETLLLWLPVSAGQTFFIPPGPVHTLGPGIALCEIQQNSDNTYRLYDYGRPRPLHLDKSLDVATLAPHPGPSEPGGSVLAACPYFTVECLNLTSPAALEPTPCEFQLLVALEGGGRIGGDRFTAGEVWLVPREAGSIHLVPDGGARLLRAWPAGRG